MENKGYMSSEDELFSGVTTEPTSYDFQSELTSDEEDYHHEVAPLAPPIGSDTKPDSTSEAAISVEPIPKSEHPLNPMEVDDGDGTNGIISDLSSVVTTDIANAKPNGTFSGVKLVDIDIPLRWLSPDEKADFMYIEVDDEDLNWNRTRRTKVSGACLDLARLFRVSLVSVPARGRGSQTLCFMSNLQGRASDEKIRGVC
ncbi:hypothetical protein B0H66DRAFT_133643 [Apodospora peruviana]|uniref:Uncharacterized protein n=1 Tax=Apodospora peruviana TaxID=516989 RepID=A0AAE0II37_9PEZI|nr:hypothetical protein B0H66DRAFT_133643 [Apodospora peruviana]